MEVLIISLEYKKLIWNERRYRIVKKRRFYEVLIIFIVLAFNSCGENTDKEKTELNSDNKTDKIRW